MKWCAGLTLVAATVLGWMHFAGLLGLETFRTAFLVASALWFVLAFLAQRDKTGGISN